MTIRGRRVRSAEACALLIAIVVLIAAHPASAQCAMCRRALDSPEGRQMIAAFQSGILVLLAAPFAVFGTIATLAVRRFRRPEPGDRPQDD